MGGIEDKDGRPIILCKQVREYLEVGLFELERSENIFRVAGFTSNGRVICSDLKVREPDTLESIEEA